MDEKSVMIIDFHTHIFPDAIASRAITSLAEEINYLYHPVTDGTKTALVKRMDEWGIDKSVIVPIVTKKSQTKTLNEWAQSIQNDRIVSFGSIFPHGDEYKQDIDFVCSLTFSPSIFRCSANFIISTISSIIQKYACIR